MNITNRKLNFLLLAFIGFGAFSQTNSKKNIYEAYDKIVGLDNTGLYNGTEFTDLFLNTDGTFRYFNGFDYSKGSVEYNGQYYSNVSLNYDLLEDNLLTRSDDNLSIFNVKLIPDFVKSFSIYNRDFVKLQHTNLSIAGNGFFEIGYLGNEVSLYIKRTKKKKDKPLKTGVQYRFSEENFYVLETNGNFYVVGKAKDVWKILPEKEDKIRQFYKSYKTLSKSNPDGFMIKLVQYLNDLGKNSNQ